jgi:hypothetical protein
VDAGLTPGEIFRALFEQPLPKRVEYPVGILFARISKLEAAVKRKQEFAARPPAADLLGERRQVEHDRP